MIIDDVWPEDFWFLDFDRNVPMTLKVQFREELKYLQQKTIYFCPFY